MPNNNSDYLNHIFSLPFSKPDNVYNCFINDIMTNKPANTTTEYNDFLLELYVDEDALFLLSIWDEFVATTNYTTNSCESFMPN